MPPGPVAALSPPRPAISQRPPRPGATSPVAAAASPPLRRAGTSAAGTLPRCSEWPIAALHILRFGLLGTADRSAPGLLRPVKSRHNRQKTAAKSAALAPHVPPLALRAAPILPRISEPMRPIRQTSAFAGVLPAHRLP